ncbi:MAG TPA: hypothetical protein VHO07_08220, partial [Streptosporangiaceae bacterium]|nr:hypothetical protein [Streptosporangiaceae bacterium]
ATCSKAAKLVKGDGEVGGSRAPTAAAESGEDLDEDRAAIAVRAVAAILGLPAAARRVAAS